MRQQKDLAYEITRARLTRLEHRADDAEAREARLLEAFGLLTGTVEQLARGT